MLGFVLQVIQDLVCAKAGSAAWAALCQEAGLPTTLELQVAYEDEKFYALVVAGAKALNTPLEALVEAVGYHFVVYTLRTEFASMFTLVGSSLADILQNINNFHGHFAVAVAKGMTPPMFRCSSVKDTSLRLHYTPGRKSRHSLAPLIVGIVKALAELVVKNIHSLTIVTEKPSGKEQAQFFISWKRIGGGSDTTDPTNSSLEERDMEIGLAGAALNRAFPFHIILNTDAEIVQYGQSMGKLVPLEEGDKLSNHFTCVYPADVDLGKASTFDNKERDPFLLEFAYDDNTSLHFKGQMVKYRFKKTRYIGFLCAPVIQSVDEMLYFGLNLSDFAVHDPTKDVIFSSARSSDVATTAVVRDQLESVKDVQSAIESRKSASKKSMKSLFMRRGNKTSTADVIKEKEAPIALANGTAVRHNRRPFKTSPTKPDGQNSSKSAPPTRDPSRELHRSNSDETDFAAIESSLMAEIGSAVAARGAGGCPVMHHGSLNASSSSASSVAKIRGSLGSSRRAAYSLNEMLLRDAWHKFPLVFRMLRHSMHEEDADDVFLSVLSFYNSHSKLGRLLQHAMSNESALTSDPKLFLREDNVASKLVSSAVRLFNSSWLQSLVGFILQSIDDDKTINKASDVNSSSPIIDRVLERVFESATQWHTGARFTLSMVDSVTALRLPAARRHALVNALFLRFLCSAIAIPTKYRLTFSLSTKQQEICRGISKNLQSIASQLAGEEDGESEQVKQRRAKLDAFLTELLDVEEIEQLAGPFEVPGGGGRYASSVGALSIVRDALVRSVPELVEDKETALMVADLVRGLLAAVNTADVQ